LILGLPDVHANRFAGAELPGGGDEKKPAAAADVEDGFVAAPGDGSDQLVAKAQFSDLATPEHDEALQNETDPDEPERGEEKTDEEEMAMGFGEGKESGEDDTHGSDDKKIADDIGGIDAVVGTRVGWRFTAHA